MLGVQGRGPCGERRSCTEKPLFFSNHIMCMVRSLLFFKNLFIVLCLQFFILFFYDFVSVFVSFVHCTFRLFLCGSVCFLVATVSWVYIYILFYIHVVNTQSRSDTLRSSPLELFCSLISFGLSVVDYATGLGWMSGWKHSPSPLSLALSVSLSHPSPTNLTQGTNQGCVSS